MMVMVIMMPDVADYDDASDEDDDDTVVASGVDSCCW